MARRFSILPWCPVLALGLALQAEAQIPKEQCLACHSNPSLSKTITVSGGTETVLLYVDAAAYAANTHGALNCVSCHTDITATNLYTHAAGGANALSKTYGSWARFSKSDTTLNADGSPRTRNYYTAASMSCAQSGCHASRSAFAQSRHHTIWRLKGAHVKTVNGETVGEAYDKTCSRCHTTCATCHFSTDKQQKVPGDLLEIWDGLQSQGETPFPDAAAMTEWAMDWTTNVQTHEFVTAAELTSGNEVCRSCHVGYYRPATYGYLSEEPPYPTAMATSIKRHPQYYEWSQSDAHSTLSCAQCHTDVHSYPDGDFDWQTQGDAQCQDCHAISGHYAQHTSVDCISCHFTGFARSAGQDAHDVWRWPVNNRVRPLAVKYKEALSWYPHNIERPSGPGFCAARCHYEGNLVGASLPVATSVEEVSESPLSFALAQNAPNPFNPSTSIEFQLAATTKVTLAVYNLLGEKVLTLASQQTMGPGTHRYLFRAEGLANGVYLYKLETPEFTDVRRMTLLQ